MIKFTSSVKSVLVPMMLLLGIFTQAQITPDSNGIIYVKPAASGNGDGSSWDDATDDLHNAIHVEDVQKVFVAVGNYNVGEHSFIMKNGVEIYGGFDPDNSIDDLSDARIMPDLADLNKGSILNGQDVRPVIWNVFDDIDPLDSTAVLDGFTIAKGRYWGNGGGIRNYYASPVFRNLLIRDNYSGQLGGGMANKSSFPTLENVIFKSNESFARGAAMANFCGDIDDLPLRNCPLQSVKLTNVLFIRNIVQGSVGGGIYTLNDCELTNVTIAENYASSIHIEGGANVTIANSIICRGYIGTGTSNHTAIYGTYTAQNSFIEGNTDTSNGNINTTGFSSGNLFTNPAALDYSLKSGSPVINAGNNALNTNNTDLNGNPRINEIIDLGAYESVYSTAAPDNNGIVYVKPTATGNGSGDSWANATDNISGGIYLNNVQQVWVAKGTYNFGGTPHTWASQQSPSILAGITIKLKNNIAVYGGFDPDNGIDDLTDERILPNPDNDDGSILNGFTTKQIVNNDFTAGNPLDNTAILDGFTLTGGKYITGGAIYNNYASPTLTNLVMKDNVANNDGGAIFNLNFSSPLITNVTIQDNRATYAGGVFNRNTSSPVMSNVVIKDNIANNDGGGMYNDVSASPVMTNVAVTGNSAQNGAGIYNRTNSSPVITNALIANNIANANGGAIRNESTSSPSLINVTIADNNGSNALYATDGTTTIDNSIVFGTISGSYAAQYSMIEGSSSIDNGNIDATDITSDDIFYNPANGDYSLKDTSLAVNAGSNALNSTTTDLAGNLRFFGISIDLGAYELPFTPSDCPDITIWNGMTWSNGEPDSDKKAIIDGNLILDADITACELEVTTNGNLQIPSGFTFTVNGLIANNASAGNFVVASDGNLIQVEDVENLGAITVIRDSQPMVRLDYTLWSSPVIGQNLFNFSPGTINGVTNYPGSAGRIYIYDGTNGYVNPSPFNENSMMNSGVGYLFRSPNNFDTTVPTVYNGTFTGVPFNGSMNVPTVAGNYTSIGNPYPSNIDTDDFINFNPEVSTLYFWNNNHSAGNSYATCTYGNCVAAAGGGNTPNGFISIGQGFIVATTGTSVNFDNSMRTQNNATFVKTYDTERHRFWLNLNDDEGNGYDQILVSYMDGATNGIDNQIDGKLFSYEGSAIYNRLDEEKFAIQGRALPFQTTDVVPLGFRSVKSGKFKIALDHFDGLFTEGNVTIYLKDKAQHRIHNLMESDYEFESGQGVFNDRFEIVYEEDGTMETDDQNAGQIRIYTDMDYIVVDSKAEKILLVELYDLNGRNIHRNDKVNANIYKVKSITKGIIVVKAQTENGEIITKKVVNK